MEKYIRLKSLNIYENLNENKEMSILFSYSFIFGRVTEISSYSK